MERWARCWLCLSSATFWALHSRRAPATTPGFRSAPSTSSRKGKHAWSTIGTQSPRPGMGKPVKWLAGCGAYRANSFRYSPSTVRISDARSAGLRNRNCSCAHATAALITRMDRAPRDHRRAGLFEYQHKISGDQLMISAGEMPTLATEACTRKPLIQLDRAARHVKAKAARRRSLQLAGAPAGARQADCGSRGASDTRAAAQAGGMFSAAPPRCCSACKSSPAFCSRWSTYPRPARPGTACSFSITTSPWAGFCGRCMAGARTS